ncbi:MAG: hypothetical protein ACU0CI_13295 [Shimia sp.]
MIRLALVLCILAAQASALSCLPVTPLDAYRTARAAPEPYAVAMGTLTLQAPPPERNLSRDGEDAFLPATFTGRALTTSGFDRAWSTELTAHLTCSGPWCGSLAEREDTLIFLERRDDDWHLTAPACGGWTFPNPTTENLRAITTCHQGGPCR